jgi:NADH dehydrogenase [ubiquinone] 1 alpha subcomplex assembly factor 7
VLSDFTSDHVFFAADYVLQRHSPRCGLSPSAHNTFHSCDAILCAQQHPELGYYTRSGAEVIGSSGDFITAPEISQLFGELLCIWCVATWQDLGCPPSFHIVEAGPGKGTLIAGLLRSSRAFPDFRAALSAVNLVETSSSMREKQAAALGCSLGATDVAGGQVAIPLPSRSRNTSITAAGAAAAATDAAAADAAAADAAAGKHSLAEGLAVHWHRALSEVPPGCTLLLAQELLDALPVHQFEYTAGGWRERLVDIDETSSSSSSSSDHSSSSSSSSSSSDAASTDDSNSSNSSSIEQQQQQQHDSNASSGLHFKHVLSPKGTPATRLLLEMPGASGIEPKPGGGSWEIGDRLEVCPLAMAFVQEVSFYLDNKDS